MGPDGELDPVSDIQFGGKTGQVRLYTEEMLKDEIEDTTGSAVWAADGASFFYAVVDTNWHPWQVRRHVLGKPVEQDSVVYEEIDSGFFVQVWYIISREYIIVNTGDIVTSEVRLIPASDPDSTPLKSQL